MANTVTSNITLDAIKPSKMIVTVQGESDLILCAKARSFEREEIFKQSHPKGTKIPKKYQQDYNLWEKLITSIHWLYPITFHDDDYSLYSEEEWERYMKENKPCILNNAWMGSIKEAFISCKFKDSTGLNGTDIDRTVSIEPLTPISFAQAGYDQHLAQTKGLSRVNVLTQQNVFSGWSANIAISYLDIVTPQETLLSLLTCVGQFTGIGARRKEGYGRFNVTSFTASK